MTKNLEHQDKSVAQQLMLGSPSLPPKPELPDNIEGIYGV